MLLAALAIRFESGKGQPILYRQERVGERGRVFNLIKFRSMRTDAEKRRRRALGDARATIASRASAGSSVARASTSCRSCGTSCAAT